MKPVQELDQLHQRLEAVRREFERYFLGLERRIPAALREDIVRAIKGFQPSRRDTIACFKHGNLLQRLMSVERYWDRVLRQIEEGTYERDVAKADRKQAQARSDKKAPPDAETARKAEQTAKAAGDEAAAFLASLGAGAPPVGLRGTPVGGPPVALRGRPVQGTATPAPSLRGTPMRGSPVSSAPAPLQGLPTSAPPIAAARPNTPPNPSPRAPGPPTAPRPLVPSACPPRPSCCSSAISTRLRPGASWASPIAPAPPRSMPWTSAAAAAPDAPPRRAAA